MLTIAWLLAGIIGYGSACLAAWEAGRSYMEYISVVRDGKIPAGGRSPHELIKLMMALVITSMTALVATAGVLFLISRAEANLAAWNVATASSSGQPVAPGLGFGGFIIGFVGYGLTMTALALSLLAARDVFVAAGSESKKSSDGKSLERNVRAALAGFLLTGIAAAVTQLLLGWI